jgi:hypothetical protein
MAFVAVPPRLAHAIKLSSLVSHHGPPQSPAHFVSEVPQPSVPLVSAPVLNPADIYVGLQLVDDSGVTFQWGERHTVDRIEIGLGQHTSFRLWSELTPFETSIALEWARDVILEHHIAQWPLIRSGDWWALPPKYHSFDEKMLPESSLMTRESSDRGRALKLAQAFLSSEPPATSQGIGPCTNSASNPCSGTGSVPITRQWSGDHSSDTDSDSEEHTTYTAAPSAALSIPNITDASNKFVWQPASSRAGAIKQTCPACPSAFGCSPDTRPDCTDRGRKYVILSHAIDKGDPRHLALAQSIRAADPDFNNFRTSQVAPGCVSGPDNWVYHTDENWARYFTQYTQFKRKSLCGQRTALNTDSRLSKLISRIDRQLSDKTVVFKQSADNLQLNHKYYALWDSVESHGLCSVTQVAQPRKRLP